MRKVYPDYGFGDNDFLDEQVIEIDHLLRDNKCLIELLNCLHSKKTKCLDKLIPWHTSVQRDYFTINSYWVGRFKLEDKGDECPCGVYFKEEDVKGSEAEYDEDKVYIYHVRYVKERMSLCCSDPS